MSAIERFVAGVDFENFKNNDEKSSAVIKKFEIIGEAAKNIPEDIRQMYPDVPWKEMSMFRDKRLGNEKPRSAQRTQTKIYEVSIITFSPLS